jgi:hypothetical protein
VSSAMENSKINSTPNNSKEKVETKHVEVIHSIAIRAKRRWIQWIEII